MAITRHVLISARRHATSIVALTASIVLAGPWARPVAAGESVAEATPCGEATLPLAFWLGNWDVYMGDTRVGTNRIREILPGCAVLEEWEDINGSKGVSLFHPDQNGDWQQVWVTPDPSRPGGFKRKTLVRASKDKLVFSGHAWLEGESFPDRTTLTREGDQVVKQLIEFSPDGGKTWQAAFEARYVRQAGTTFECGEVACSIETEYCHKAYPGAVIPGQPPSVDRCLPLPAPDCSEIERSGRCLGDPERGITIEVYFP